MENLYRYLESWYYRRDVGYRLNELLVKRILILVFLMMPYKAFITLVAQDRSSEPFSWLEGKWRQVTGKEDQASYELWQRKTHDNLMGVNWTIEGSDTTFIEKLSLTEVDETWYYEALIHPASTPVRFTIEELSDEGFIARNRQHDFPKQIQYSKINSHRFKATISDENRSIDFEFIRN